MGVVPIYLNLVRRISADRAHPIIVVSGATVACLLAAAAGFGREILEFFNVGMDDFRIAGGLLALVIAFEMFGAHYGAFTQTLEERAEDLKTACNITLVAPRLVGLE